MILGITEKCTECGDVFESWFVGFFSINLVIGSLVKKPFYLFLIFLIGHGTKFSKVFGIEKKLMD